MFRDLLDGNDYQFAITYEFCQEGCFSHNRVDSKSYGNAL